MTKTEIDIIIKSLGFSLINGETDKWNVNKNSYEITIDLQGTDIKNWAIDYGSEIIVHRKNQEYRKTENCKGQRFF